MSATVVPRSEGARGAACPFRKSHPVWIGMIGQNRFIVAFVVLQVIVGRTEPRACDSLRPNLATEIHKHVDPMRQSDRRYLVALARCERCKAGLEFLTVVRSRGDDGRHARAAGRKDQCAKDRRIKSEATMPTHGLMRVLAAGEPCKSGYQLGFLPL